MENIASTLSSLGLSEKQVSVYETLLSLGRASANALAEKTGLKRPTTYLALEELEALGLVAVIPGKAKKLYRPLSPHLLIEKRKQQLLRAERVVPEIEAQLNSEGIEDKPRVLYFKGVKGVKDLTEYRKKELANKTLTGFWATTEQEVLDLFGDHFHKLSRDLVKMNTFERGISTDDPRVAEYNEMYNQNTSDLVEKRILPANIYNPEVSFEFSDQWLKIYDFTNLQGLIIESPRAAQAMSQIFELAWRGAEVAEKESKTP